MAWLPSLLWGLLGGALVAGVDFITIVGETGDVPWKKLRATPYFSAVVVRILISGGLAAAAGESAIISNPLAAVMVGAATPLIVDKLAKAGAKLAGGHDAIAP
jgi:hypothetical protein